MATLMDIVKKGATNRSVTLRIIDDTAGTPETGVVFNTSGIDLWYRRESAAVVFITEADLTTPALTDAHADGGFLHISHGEYRFDIPDAAFATGAQHVDIGGTVTGMIVIGGRVRLVDYDPEDTVRLGLTGLPNAAADAAGGLPISDAGGLDLDAMNANVNDIETSVDAIVADTNELQTDDMPGKIAALNNISTAQVNTQVDTALADYDGPTKAEMDTGHGLLATEAKQDIIDTNVDSTLADTNELQTDDVPGLIAALNNISTAQVNTQVDNAMVTYGLDHLVSVSVAGSDITDNSIVAKLVSKESTADWDDFVNTTDSLQAIADAESSPPTAAVIADAVWDETQSSHTTSGSFGEIAIEIASTLADSNELQGDDVPGLIAALNNISTAQVNAEADTALSDYDPPTKAEMDTAHGLLATEAKQDVIDANVDQIETATAEIGTAGAGLLDLGGMSSGMKAQVNTEAKDVLSTDTMSELGVGAPSATPTIEDALMLLYMALRNKLDITATSKEVHNDAGTQIASKTLSDDGTTYSESEMA